MTTTLFVDEEYLKNYAPISSAVDVNLLWPFVAAAQQTDVMPLIGKKLHDRLVTSINSNIVTEEEAELLSLLRDCLVWSSMVSYLVFGSIKLRGEGAVRQSGDGNSAATLEEITFLRNESRAMFNSFAERVEDYLRTHRDSFSEYLSTDEPKAKNHLPDFGIGTTPDRFNGENWRDSIIEYWKHN